MSRTSPFRSDRPILVGMVHLPPLPGAPGYAGSWQAVLEAAQRDAAALAEGGADALMLENFNDVPFFRDEVPRETIACLTAAAIRVTSAVGDMPVGVNVLRNDARSALAVALGAGCGFLRVNVLCGARLTDQGIIQGNAAELLRDRARLGVSHIAIWADVDVKHSAPLADRPLEDEVADTLQRGGADALIVSGSGTGRPTDVAKLARVKAAAGEAPVLVGSGATLEALEELREHCDGLIVGTSLKHQGRVDAKAVGAFAAALRGG